MKKKITLMLLWLLTIPLLSYFSDFEEESILKSLINPYNDQVDYGLFVCKLQKRNDVVKKKRCNLKSDEFKVNKKIQKKYIFEINIHDLGRSIFQVSFKGFDIRKVASTRKNDQSDYNQFIIIIPYRNKRINGTVKIYQKGKLINRSEFVDNLPHGDAFFYTVNSEGRSKLSVKKHYQNGLISGKVLHFNENEDLVKEVEYRQNRPQGKYFLYHTNGEYKFKCKIVDQDLEGICQIFDDGGKMIYQLEYHNGSVVNGVRIYDKKTVPLNLAQRYKLQKDY